MVEVIVQVAAEAAEAVAEAAEEATEVADAGLEATESVQELGALSPGIAEVGGANEIGYFNAETQGMRNEIQSAADAEQFERELPAQLEACNPNYELADCWKINCQRCVPTYEMRMRGYDVTAKPCEQMRDYIALHPFDVWKNPEVINCNGLDQITEQMAEWGDGARSQIVVTWKGGNGGHTFVAEQVDGKTRIFDPQNHDIDVTDYFENVEPGSVQFCRMDNLEVNEELINLCCEQVEV